MTAEQARQLVEATLKAEAEEVATAQPRLRAYVLADIERHAKLGRLECDSYPWNNLEKWKGEKVLNWTMLADSVKYELASMGYTIANLGAPDCARLSFTVSWGRK